LRALGREGANAAELSWGETAAAKFEAVTMAYPQPLTLEVGDTQRVSGLLVAPAQAHACLVLGHGAGAGMTHPFMAALADGLAERGVATLRYQFPFAEQGARRPDPPDVAQATVRAAVNAAARLAPQLPLVAGGKSFGGRMTSQAQAASPLPGVRGLAFVGFPLHPAGKPSLQRARHLADVHVPMLFLQGTRDALADFDLVQELRERLGPRATLVFFEDADHAFHVRVRSGGTDAGTLHELLDRLAAWIMLTVA
jgi:predicted alpha/beta-hydrolase family hydrolase